MESEEWCEMVNHTEYLTPEGMENLEKRLRHLKEVRRSEVAERSIPASRPES